MSKRKILLLAAMLCMIAILAVGGTLAYFTDNDDKKVNTFTVGNVEIELTEPSWDAEGELDAHEVYPGEALAKDPTVTNKGKNPCFVRVKVTGLDCLGDAGNITLRYIDAADKYHDGYNANDWTLYKGYYYYKHVLTNPGDTYNTDLVTVTPPVFSQIVIPTGLTNGNGTTKYDINVYAQAVQAQGAQPSWTDVKAMSVEQIAAWFATCGMPEAGEQK